MFLQRFIGLVLLGAASMKGYQLSTEPVLADGIWRSRWFLATVVEAELLLAAWFLAGPFPRLSWRLAIACFSMFSGVSVWKGLLGARTCGCFGNLEVNPWWTASFDIAVVAALWHWRPQRQEPVFPARRVRLQLVVALTLAVLCGVPFGIAMATFDATQLVDDGGEPLPEGEIVLLEPEGWVGQRLPVLRYLDIAPDLQEGEWIVLFYHHDCSVCQAVIPEYEDLASRQHPWEPRVALVQLPPYGDDRPERRVGCVAGRMQTTNEWFMSTPCHVDVKDGIVQRVEMKVEPGYVFGREQKNPLRNTFAGEKLSVR